MPTIWGLTIGDDGTGFVVPDYAQIREALASRIRQLRGIANLHTEPGSVFGDIIDLVTTGIDIANQGAQQAVARTIFTAMQGVALDQFLADYLVRVQASASTVTVYFYGSAGAAQGAGSILRTAPTGDGFTTDGAIVIPAAPAEAYAFEIVAFATGAYAGQTFTVTVNGTPFVYVANAGDDGFSVRNGLVNLINAGLLSQTAYRGGQSPTSSRYAALVIEEGGGGAFPLAVAGPASTIFSYPAIGVGATAQVTGPTPCPPEALRYIASPGVGIVGAVNPEDGVLGRTRETDSQFRARHQIAQRGLGGGSPDAVRAIILSPVEVGGGGATFCSVEYNPTNVIDAAGNLPHSLRVVVDQAADAASVGLALWKAKAAGDNTNGPELVVITDAEGNPQNVYIDRLADVWIGVEIEVKVGPAWPNTGSPLDQLRQDVAEYIESLQPSGNGGGVRVNLLPISTFPNGDSRGVINFRVRVGEGPAPGGPFVYQDWYPDVEPDANAASVLLTSREKARCVVTDVSAVIV